jgi:hypothetical protein
MIHVNLPVPAGVVPIHISGGASVITVRRPAGVAARVNVKGVGSMVDFDNRKYIGTGNNTMLHSADFTTTDAYYSFDIASAGSMITVSLT